MAWRIIKQPNGKYARFSSVVDAFTHGNLTKEEALELCQTYMSEVDSIGKVRRAEEDVCPGSNSSDGLNRWREALEIITLIHGEEDRDTMVKEILGDDKSHWDLATSPAVTKALDAELADRYAQLCTCGHTMAQHWADVKDGPLVCQHKCGCKEFKGSGAKKELGA